MFCAGIARRISPEREQREHLRLAEAAALDQQEIVDQHAFLFDGAADRRHRARRDAADIGVMAARGDVRTSTVAAGLVEHRRDHGDVGQMRAAVVGRVQHVDVARLACAMPLARAR